MDKHTCCKCHITERSFLLWKDKSSNHKREVREKGKKMLNLAIETISRNPFCWLSAVLSFAILNASYKCSGQPICIHRVAMPSMHCIRRIIWIDEKSLAAIHLTICAAVVVVRCSFLFGWAIDVDRMTHRICSNCYSCTTYRRTHITVAIVTSQAMMCTSWNVVFLLWPGNRIAQQWN